MILTARGPEQQSKGVENVLSFINPALALGKAGKPYCGYGCLTGQGNGQGGREHGQKADQLPGYRKIDNPAHRKYIAEVWGIEESELPGPGRSAYELLDSSGVEGGVRALFVFASDPVVSAPRAAHVEERLRALDLLVVSDFFLPETAKLADVVLPCTQWAEEEEGTMTNLEGRVLLRRRVMQSPPQVRSDIQALSSLAERFGYGTHFPNEASAAFRELRQASSGGIADYAGISSAVFRALADGVEDPASKPGLASLLITIWADEYQDERDARFINDRVHANIQKNGSFSVVPPMPGGVTNPAQLRRIADVADKHHVPMVKLTGGQRIDLIGVKKEDLPNIWRDLDMPSGHAYGKSYRTCKSCVGTDFCRFGVGDSTALAIRIEKHLKGIDSPGKLKMATAGCPRNCSEAMVKDVGAVAVEGGKWEIYIGGAAGAHVRKGDILCVVDSHDEGLKYVSRFVQYYRENAKYLERTYGFVERLGIEKIRSVVVDDSEGIAAQLEENLLRSTAAYRDPWREAYAPKTLNQFASTLPVIQ